MDTWILLALWLAFFIIVYLIVDTIRPADFPPGPMWLPVVGNIYLFYSLRRKLSFVHLVWSELAKRYGPIVGVRMGRDVIVIVSGIELVREVLIREEFEGRPDGFLFRLRAFGKRLGVVFVDGVFGVEQRKFCMKQLRRFGLGKTEMQERIAVEAKDFISCLQQKSKEGPVYLHRVVNICILNYLWGLTAGKRFDIQDARLTQLLGYIHESFRLQDMSGGLLNQMPFIRYIAPGLSNYNKTVEILQNLSGFIKETVDEHCRTRNPEETRDFIDSFLTEIEKNKSNKDSQFSEQQLLVLLMDMFMAGSDSTTNTLCFIVLYMLHNPHVQTRAQQELDEVIGRNRLPTLNDRKNLPYIEAIIMESLRLSTTAPTAVGHRAKTNVTIHGYKIPKQLISAFGVQPHPQIVQRMRMTNANLRMTYDLKSANWMPILVMESNTDTTILINLYSVLMDKEHWGDPETFRPERFIDSEGNIIQDEWLIPFGLGKRRCLGETIARPNLFLFLTAILQNFIISYPPGKQLPSINPVDGATLSPQRYACIFTPRHPIMG